jgi:hypothetical protein
MKFRLQKQNWRLVGLLAADALLFSNSNATKVPSYMVIIGFILLSLTCYYLVYGLISFSGYYGVHVRRKHTLSFYITAITGVLVALQSIGELGTRDIWVLLPLALLGYFYSAYAKKASA